MFNMSLEILSENSTHFPALPLEKGVKYVQN